MRKSIYKQSGFTLLELLVALGMIGILVAIGVPAMSDWSQRAQVRSEAQRYVGILNLARSTAIETNQVVSIDSTTNADGGLDMDVFSDADGAGNQAYNGGGGDQYIRRVVGEATSLNIVIAPAGVDVISFDQNGRLMGGQVVQIDIENDNANLGRVIDVNLSGRSTVSEKTFGG